MDDLFAGSLPAAEPLGDGAVLLRGRAGADAGALLAAIEAIAAVAPFRQFTTPGGREMSVAMTNAGVAGWVSDRAGYRYQGEDPLTGRPWPAMPAPFAALAREAAAEAGFAGFAPDVCLINRYRPGTKLSLHQDRDEADLGHPIVSVSLGLPATFQFGGLARTDPVRKVPLVHGDIVVWGGPARLAYHGILTLKAGEHPATGPLRYNLTFRRSG
ncbi:DNA oxidative demethylase AlkB [Methylobrevis albus]|uniref:DNA oxidative demethylase AlkB n=1 Tax=Methylobrevis albus TaxID=2793297 RepID=A0A931HZ56_9HYPH|nr:DNA oxidative demethylase AlkB [Methylobrevis albus]MBH0236328.1 DNA oxidative demethylase AlkB [Methylobrevis albus]